MTNASNTTPKTQNTKNTNTTENKTTKSKIVEINTIAKLEQKIKGLQVSKTKSAKQDIDELKREIRHLQEKYKAAAMELEKNNLSELIFIDSTNGFKKLVGNSALFYTHDIAKRIGRRVNLLADTDRYSRSENGVVCLKLTGDLENSLASVFIVRSSEQQIEGLTRFMLPAKHSTKELEEIKNDANKISEQINTIVVPKSLIPTIFSDLRELNVIVFQHTQNMPPFARNIIGSELLATSDKMLLRYCETTNGDLKVEDGLLRIIKGARFIKYEMKNVESLRLMHNKTIMQILELVVRIEKEALKEYKIRKMAVEKIIKNAVREEQK